MNTCGKRTSVSIIIPTFNSSESIGKAIESVLPQILKGWEILIMDGASKDNTIKIAQSYNDCRIHVYSEPDNGIYDAMNKGIKKAHGEWLYFLGSDDYLLNSNVLCQMLSNADGVDMVYGDVQSTHLPVEHHGEWRDDTLYYNRCHQAIFYHRSVFDKVGFYPLKYPICADHYINLRLFLNKKIRLQYKPVEVAYHSAGGASTTETDVTFYNDLDRLIVRYGIFTLPKPILKKHCQKALSHHCTRPQRIALMLLYTWLRATTPLQTQ